MIRTCKDCGRDFEITWGEVTFYKSNNLNLPKRCKPCRKKNAQYGNVRETSRRIPTRKNAQKRTVNRQSGEVNLIHPAYRDDLTPGFDPSASLTDYSKSKPNSTPQKSQVAIDTSPHYGDKLWYINKRNGKLEAVLFISQFDSEFSFRYKSKIYTLPNDAIGTRLFLTRTGARKNASI